MSEPEPSIRVSVDPTNPGQFFACCGLLELADRLWPGAEGWFAEGGREFRVAYVCPLDSPTAGKLLNTIIACRIENAMSAAQSERLAELSGMSARERSASPELEDERKQLASLRREAPIILGTFSLRVDWFLDELAGGDRYKTWAGQQSVISIATAMHTAIAREWADVPPARWLGHVVTDESLPFNFDSYLGGQSSAIDCGFSADPLQGVLSTPGRIRPLLEFLAFVGLQRFRPTPADGENRHRFTLWQTPLPPQVASLIASSGVVLPGAMIYDFPLLYRTQYLKSFLPAQRVRGVS